MASAAGRKWLWALWTFATAVSVLSIIMCLVTFSSLVSSYHYADVTGVPASQLSAAAAGTLLSAIFMVLLLLVSFFVLLRMSALARSERSAGFAYAFVAATYLNLSFFLLLTGLTLTSNHRWLAPLQNGNWTNGDTNAYNFTYVLCFITVGVYCCMFAGLVMLSPVLQGGSDLDEAGMTTQLRSSLPMSHIGSGAAAPRGSTAAVPGGVPSDHVDGAEAAPGKGGASGAWHV